MPEPSFAPQFVEISAEESLRLLGTTRVGRVGLSVGALPVILPVNFALFEGAVVMRTIPGTKLQAAAVGAIVAFEADGYEPDGRAGWSVMIQGQAREVSDPGELAQLRGLPLEAWALDGAADRFVRIEASIITGRSFAPRDEPDV